MDEKSPPLSEERAKLFHRMVIQLLFASKRAQPDIQVCAAFLCTRVKYSTERDYKKLARVISYLQERNHSSSIDLIVGADTSGKVIWNVDASYMAHPDCKSHTVACLTFDHENVLSLSSKQKIATQNSTKAELVGVNDAMTFVM